MSGRSSDGNGRRGGLNDWAKRLISGEDCKVLLYTRQIVRIYADGKREVENSTPYYDYPHIKSEQSGYFIDAASERALYKYTLPNGRVIVETIQAQKNSGRPDEQTFLALRKDEGGEIIPESLWTNEEMKLSF